MQVWFAERIGQPVAGYRSLDRCWSDWAENCDPVLPPALFEPVVQSSLANFKKWLNEPPKRPFIIGADSREEALAFLCCLVGSMNSVTNNPNAGTVVFTTPEALQRFGTYTATPRIAVIHGPEVEKEIVSLHRRCHCVILRPGNDVHTQPDIRLGLLGWKDFANALNAIGLPEDRIERLARESARSPTVLRRRLSKIPAIQTPRWTGEQAIARKLLPAALVGAWHIASRADREIVRLLARVESNTHVDNDMVALLALVDPPLWSAGEYRGVVSRIDALAGIANFVTESDLENFFTVAEYVLSEKDPAIDLPEEQQRMAPVYGKVREHSSALRSGIRETLILLSVFGSDLFGRHSSFNFELRVARLVHDLLSPLDREKILSHNADLPDYAEAAPETFLSMFEMDVRQTAPVVRELLRWTGDGLTGSPLRTHLLWALESLAWNPKRFPRVVRVLADICKMNEGEDGDNWTNKPVNTLSSLFRSWLPQTAATLDDRIQTFDKLCHDYPRLTWPICVGQIGLRSGFATRNHRPHWRDDAANSGRSINEQEHFAFVQKVEEIVLDWPMHNEGTLADLLDRLGEFCKSDQLRIWDLVEQWAETEPPEDAKAYLRQRIHSCAHLRWVRRESICHPERERAASEKLLPSNLVTRHAWLFSSRPLDFPPEGSEYQGYDHHRDEQRRRHLRLEALREIWQVQGIEGIRALLDHSQTNWHTVGGLMAEILDWNSDAKSLVWSCLRNTPNERISQYKFFLSEFLWNAKLEFIDALIAKVHETLNSDSLLKLFLCLPYGNDTWNRLNDVPQKIREAYWKAVNPRIWINLHGEEEINRSIDELLEVNRAPTAFSTVCAMWDKVETSRLNHLLNALVSADAEELQHIDMLHEYISEAFDALDERPGIPTEDKARLEFAFLSLLDGSQHGVPNLEAQVATSPELYAQAIACIYDRSDGREDESGFRATNPEQQRAVADSAYRLLERVRHIPGTNAHGGINIGALKAWLREVREFCAKHDRVDIGEVMIGKLLARADHIDEDGIWPSRAVCEALQWMASEPLGDGFVVGTLDRRGVHSRALDEGGNQERKLAARYRRWARHRGEYPYVTALLERIAVSYDEEGKWHDTRAEVRQRLPYL